jgi:hypothetical protein
MGADTDGRLAEQLAAFRETARWRITNDGARPTEDGGPDRYWRTD